MDLSLRWVHIDVNSVWFYFKAKINKRMTTLGEKDRVSLLYGFPYRGRFDRAMIDEEEDRSALDVVIGIGGPA